MRFLRIIFWGGLIAAAAAYWLYQSDNSEEKKEVQREAPPVDWNRLRGFHSLDLQGGYQVVVHPSEESYVEVEGPAEIIDRLQARVEGQVLEVEQPDRRKFRRKDKITLHIYANELREIDASGAVDMRSEHVIQAQQMDIDVAGAGRIELKLKVEQLTAEISGAGKYILVGQASEAAYQVSGAGEVKAFGLQAEQVSVDIAGAGSAQVYANQSLRAGIAGAGKVVYDGDVPDDQVKKTVLGAGSVRRR